MRRRRYHAAVTKAEGLEARLQQLEGAAAQQAQQGQQAQLRQALEGAVEARRAAEQRAEEAEQQLEQLMQQLSQGEQRGGGGGGGGGWVFGSVFGNIGKALGGGRKRSGGSGGEAAVRQPLPQPQQQDSPRRAAGRELAAALQIAAAAAPTAAASVRPRLLHCYDTAPIIGFGPTEQLQALEGLAKAVEGFAEGCLQRISGNADAAVHLVRSLDEWLLRLLRPAGASAAAGGGAPTTADACSLLLQLHDRRLLVPALAHMTLRWMQSELWLHPLSLAGLGSVAEEVLVSGGGEEQEAALQLRALSFQRLYRQFMAGQLGLRGCMQGQGGAIMLPLTTGCAAGLDRVLVWKATDLCQRLGLGLVADAAVQVVRQGYALGLLMGAAHPELRPLVSVSGSQLEAGRHAVVREVQGGGGGSEVGSGGGGGQVVLLSRRPGWVFWGRQQVHIKEEVVAVQA
jgi:hypothetical protein